MTPFPKGPPAVVAAAIVLVFLVCSFKALIEETMVFDEVVDLPSGYLSAARGDFSMDPEHVVLLKQFAALPLLVQDIRVPEGSKTGDHMWGFGFRFFYGSGNRPGLMLVSARLMALFWGVLLILSVYAISRERYGEAGGLLSLTVAAFCPTLLAHAHFVMCDVSVSALILLTVVAFDRWLDRPTPWRGAQAGILLAGAILCKYSALILPLLLQVVAVVRIIGRRKAGEAVPWKLLWGSAACIVGSTYIVLWGAYRFRFQATEDLATMPWNVIPQTGTLTASLIGVARAMRLLPESFLYGLAVMDAHLIDGHGCYALGRIASHGWWWYFPLAFVVKTPVTSLALFGWSLVEGFRKDAETRRAQFLWFLFPAVFGLLSIRSGMDIGIRQILPILPFLYVTVGCLGRMLEGAANLRLRRAVVVGLAGLGVLDCLLSAPHFVPYFNIPARLTAERHEILADSNLDMGQDLSRLKAYLDERGIRDVKLSYFGTASPAAIGLSHQVLPGFSLHSQLETQWQRTEELRSGDIVAVSVTNLVGVYLSDKNFFRRRLAGLRPIDRIGHSILIYRIP